MKLSASRMLRVACAGLVLALAPACGSIADSLLNTYTGPGPSQDDLSGEVAIVRTVRVQPETGIQSFFLDRERFLTTAPHDINRVVLVTARDVQPAVTPMELKVGDRVRISTTFLSFTEAGDLARDVPDWPFDRYDEYPLGFHALTEIERLAP
jgi:hypothetical protein